MGRAGRRAGECDEGGSLLLALLFMLCGCSTCSSIWSLYHSFYCGSCSELAVAVVAPCPMLHAAVSHVASRCPNGKQIYALSSKNLYGMQVPQLVAVSKGNNRNILKKMFRILISIRFRFQGNSSRDRTHPHTYTPTHSLRNWQSIDRR